MMDLFCYIILPVIGSIFIAYVIFDSMRQIGISNKGKRWQKPWIRRTVVGIYIAVMILIACLGNGILNLCVMILIPVIGYLFYNDSKIYVVYDVIFVIAVYLTDVFVVLCMNLLQKNGVLVFLNAQSFTVMAIMADRLLEFMVLKLLVFLIRKKERVTQFTAGQMIATVLLPVSSIIILFTLIAAIEIYPVAEMLVMLALDIFILLAINIYFINLFDAVNRNNRLKNELQLYRQQEKMQKEYYENLEQKYRNTRKLVHDIRNHLQVMEHLYEEQQNETGIRYTKDIHDILNQLGMKYYTGNKMLNIILNDKVQQMETKGITADIKIADCNLDFMREVDITTIFGNLLDNAIEAAEEAKEKVVRLKVVTVHEFISVTLENSSAKDPKRDTNVFYSQKKNHEGLGLKNVERTVAAYKGDIQYEWRKPYFITRVMLGA